MYFKTETKGKNAESKLIFQHVRKRNAETINNKIAWEMKIKMEKSLTTIQTTRGGRQGCERKGGGRQGGGREAQGGA